MRRSSRLDWCVLTVGALMGGAALLCMRIEGAFSEADCARAFTLGTLDEIEVAFGPPVPDAESGLYSRENGTPTFWKAWRGDVNDLYVQFDSKERVVFAMLQPRKVVFLHRMQGWLER